MTEISGHRYFYLKDRQQSIVGVTDENGSVVEFYDYSPFGQMTCYDNDGLLLAESTIGNPYGYTGRRLDAETGLWYYRNRMYSATLGRFLQRDPAGFVDGLNLYAYVKNNPLRLIDSFGLVSRELGSDPTDLPVHVLNDITVIEKKTKLPWEVVWCRW